MIAVGDGAVVLAARADEARNTNGKAVELLSAIKGELEIPAMGASVYGTVAILIVTEFGNNVERILPGP